MGKQNKRKSEAGTVASPKKIKAEPKSPKAVETPKKVKIQAKSPKPAKNKPLKTPIKHKAPKNPTESNAGPTQKKKNKPAVPVQKKAHIIPEEIIKTLTRRQKRRVYLKLKTGFQKIGKEDLSEVDMKDPQVKEIIDKLLSSDKVTKTLEMNEHTKNTAVEKKAIKKEPISPVKKVKKETSEEKEATKTVKVQKIQSVKKQKKAKSKQKKAAN